MKHIKSLIYGLLLTINLVYSGTALSATGMVILRDKDKALCNLPVPEPGDSKDYSFPNETTPCNNKDWNDRARTIQLAEVPSATTILVANNRNCWDSSGSTDAPWFRLKTTRKQTSTTIIHIDYLAAFREGQIIEPGLQMLELKTAADNLDKISCVRITTSAAPPSS